MVSADDITGALHRDCLCVKQVWVTLVNPGRFNRHRTVDIYWERVEFAGAEQFIQVIEDLLRASDGKRGDKDARLADYSVLNDRAEFGQRFLQRFVVAITVCG